MKPDGKCLEILSWSNPQFLPQLKEHGCEPMPSV